MLNDSIKDIGMMKSNGKNDGAKIVIILFYRSPVEGRGARFFYCTLHVAENTRVFTRFTRIFTRVRDPIARNLYPSVLVLVLEYFVLECCTGTRVSYSTRNTTYSTLEYVRMRVEYKTLHGGDFLPYFFIGRAASIVRNSPPHVAFNK